MLRIARRTLLPLIASVALAGHVLAQDEEAAVAAVLDKWAASYSDPASTPETMLALYDPDSVFWGTGAQVPFIGAAEIGPYFGTQFANFPNRKVSFVQSVIRAYGDTATATGLYRFEVQTQAGQKVDVTHRFSFTLTKRETGWVLVHQHSSQMPPRQ
jgi:uncharacterized protein (TIGR02246 family)